MNVLRTAFSIRFRFVVFASLLFSNSILLAQISRELQSPPNQLDEWIKRKEPRSYHPKHVLVRFKAGVSEDQRFQIHRKITGNPKLKRYRSFPNLQRIEVESGKVLEAIKKYQSEADVLYAEPDYQLSLLETVPNDPAFAQLWGLKNNGQSYIGGLDEVIGCQQNSTPGADIRAPKAWDLWTGDPNFKIAVIDTGVDYNHPDLAANVWTNVGEIPGNGIDDDGNGWIDDVHGYDMANDDSDPMDDHGHGTHIAGTIGAVGNNGIGITGINWQCKIVALKIFTASGIGSPSSEAVEALDYCIANNIQISNNSWHLDEGFSQALYDAILQSQSIGHLFVVAAGNGQFNLDHNLSPNYGFGPWDGSPAAYDLENIISVAATDNHDQLAVFSSYGLNSVDLGAPGVCIYSLKPDGEYRYNGGTSMAAPHVAGVAALIRSRLPQLNWRQVKDRILYSARSLPTLQGRTVSGGVLDAAAALWDCNENGIPDELDISGSQSLDCNGNLFPDECEPDCNNNDIADSCDLASGLSLDCPKQHGNQVLDECELDADSNQIADSCDIAGGADDCNRNGLLDSLEPGGNQDCNANGSPDLCDIYFFLSKDCNRNSIPDECDLSQGSSVDTNGNGLPDECDSDATVALVPVGASGAHSIIGNVIFLDQPGQRIQIELRISGWDPNGDGFPRLRGHQANFEIQGGISGTLGIATIPCSSDEQCNSWLSSCQLDGYCDGAASVYVDVYHPNFVYGSVPILWGGYPPGSPAGFTILALTFNPSNAAIDPGIPKYGGSLVLEVSPDAAGAFTVAVNPNPNLTLLRDSDSVGQFANIEIQHFLPVRIVLPSDCNGNGVQDYQDVISASSADCNGNLLPDECEIDCNGNSIPDSCDLANGTSQDCNHNRVPDDCEVDCNNNGVPDSCDLTNGSSTDCNENNLPDECEALDDCDSNVTFDVCDIHNGNGSDCNENSVLDICDISSGASFDCDGNEIPDECQELSDCNGNGILDICDFAGLISLDCNENQIPDECEGLQDCNLNGYPDLCELSPSYFPNYYLGTQIYTGQSSAYNVRVRSNIDGNLYFAGEFSGTKDLDPGPYFNLQTSNAGLQDLFVSKYFIDGNLDWAVKIGGPQPESLQAFAVSSEGDVFVAGRTSGVVDFDPGQGVDQIDCGLTSPFITKLHSDGSYGWTRVFSALNMQSQALSVGVDQSIVLAGLFSGTVDFDPSSGVDLHPSTPSNFDLFVLKLSSEGEFRWARSFGATGSESLGGLSISESGDIYLGGGFPGAIDFDPSSAGSDLHTSAGSYDAFLMSLDMDGNYRWTKTFGGSNANFDGDRVGDVVAQEDGIYVAGGFLDVIDFDPSTEGVDLQGELGKNQLFLSKYDSNGSYVWAKVFGKTSSSSALILEHGFHGNLYLFGYAPSGVSDFDPSATGVDLQGSTQGNGAFITAFQSNGDYLKTRMILGASCFGCGPRIFYAAVQKDQYGADRLHTTGFFAGTVDFNPDSLGTDIHYEFSGRYFHSILLGVYPSSDCNGNLRPDTCDLESGKSLDLNGDAIPDECQLTALPAPIISAVGGRYLSITVPAGTPSIALRLSSPEFPCLLKYVQADGSLANTPVFRSPSAWGTVFVHGTEIVPGRAYTVRSQSSSLQSLDVQALTWEWGDVSGPDFVVNLDDILGTLAAFRGNFTEISLQSADLMGFNPDQIITLDDILAVLAAFSGFSYQGPNPCP